MKLNQWQIIFNVIVNANSILKHVIKVNGIIVGILNMYLRE